MLEVYREISFRIFVKSAITNVLKSYTEHPTIQDFYIDLYVLSRSDCRK